MSKEDQIIAMLEQLQTEVQAIRFELERMKEKKYPSISIEDMKKAIAAKADEYGIKRATLFGSRARGDYRPDSDVDLLIEFSRPIGLFKLSGLKIQLEETWGLPVDIVSVPLPPGSFLEIDKEVELYAA